MEVSTLTRARLAQHQEYLRSDSEGKTGSVPQPPKQHTCQVPPCTLHILDTINTSFPNSESDMSTLLSEGEVLYPQHNTMTKIQIQ